MVSIGDGRDRTALVLGGSGLVGRHLLRRAVAEGWRLHVVSRSPQSSAQDGSMHWHGGTGFDLYSGAGPWPQAPVVFSAGPLDGLAAWLERTAPVGLRRLVALGSTSVEGKRDSPDSAERALAERLAESERRVQHWCREAGVCWTLLRPTLIWGDGRDRNLSRLARWARRLRFLPVPSFATGRRQPIHADEVATAMLAAIDATASENSGFDLPGGEIVSYREMVRRIAAAVAPPGRILSVPGVLLRPALALSARLGVLSSAAAIMRMSDDLVFDGEPAWQALCWRPGSFRPQSGDFPCCNATS